MNEKPSGAKESTSSLLSLPTSSSYAQDMARTVNISEAKANLSKLADEVASGEEVIVSRAGKPMMKLVPLTAQEVQFLRPQTAGGVLGKYAEEFKDFDWEKWDRLDEEVHKMWRKFGYMD